MNEYIIRTCPKARQENIIRWEYYRITVLQDRLFRIEKSKNGKFRDCATQAVWYRNFETQKYTVSKDDGRLTITTDFCVLQIAGKREDCVINVGNGFIPVSNAENLKGTYRSLDGCNGDTLTYSIYGSDMKPGEKVELCNGFCSLSGVAVYDDSDSLELGDDGLIKSGKASGSDEYVFAYGDDYRGAVKAAYKICGDVPVLPRYAFGNWWSRYHAYSDREYLNMIGEFEKRKIPLTVTALDTDWHYSNKAEIAQKFSITESQLLDEKIVGVSDRGNADKIGWTGYTFNPDYFPDYKKFLRILTSGGYKVTLNLHPHQGVRFWEKQYRDAAEYVGWDASGKQAIAFDFTDPKYVAMNFDVLLEPYEKDGVGFWWIDWQQGKKSRVEGLDPLWSLNHYHFLNSIKGGKRGLILSRYFGVGAHRYPVGFSGDTAMTWETLKYLPYFTATAANVGYGWWSHDIGGHNEGVKDDELYLRFVQFGVFSPINRLHCTNLTVMTKEPWEYKNGKGRIAEDFLRLRHSMIPFWYSLSYLNNREGLVPVEPLYYRWKNREAYAAKNEYLLGGKMIVAPITEHSVDGYSVVDVWLPEGKWTDMFTYLEYDIGVGGEWIKAVRNLESIPVFVESGAIIPFSLDDGNGTDNPVKLGIKAFNGNGEFTLFEDGTNGEAFTRFSCECEESENKIIQKIVVSVSGERSVIPDNRIMRIEFSNFSNGKAYVEQGRITSAAKIVYGEKLTVEVGDCKTDFAVTVESEKTGEKRIMDFARTVLTEAEGNNYEKQRLYDELEKTRNIESFNSTVYKSGIADAVKLRLSEITVGRKRC